MNHVFPFPKSIGNQASMENNILVVRTPNPALPSKFAVAQSPLTQSPLTLHQSPPVVNSQQPIGVALFGAGRWGSHLLRNFLAQPQATVMAVVDADEDNLNTLPQRFNLSRDVVLTTDWQAALSLPGIQAAIIATPAISHYTLIRSALLQGLHVLAEKPLTLDLAESRELCDLALQQQRQLVVDHTYLFHSAVQQGSQVVRSGQLGELRYGYATRTHLGPVRHDVDALWDLAIHDIAIFNCWLNESPIQVQAQGTVWLQSQTSSPMGLSDLVWVKLIYTSGFQAFIHLCWSNPDKQRRLSLVGSQGTLVFDELAASPLTLLQGKLEKVDRHFAPTNQNCQPIAFEPTEPLQQVCSHFLTCAQHNTPSWISSGNLGSNLVGVLTALTRSLHQGGTVVCVEEME